MCHSALDNVRFQLDVPIKNILAMSSNAGAWGRDMMALHVSPDVWLWSFKIFSGISPRPL